MTLGKYFAVARLSMAQGFAARSVFLGRVALFGLLLAIYARIWTQVAEHGALAGLGRTDLIWYLAVTEWIALSLPPLHLDIEADVRNGSLAYHLPRPASYLWLRFCEGLGTLFVRMLTLGAFGFTLALFLGGRLPSGGVLALLCGALTAVASATLSLLCCALIGLCAFFLDDTSPLYWVWQKLGFVLGGLMFPLDIYPSAIQRIAHATPFPSLLYAPGRIAIGAPSGLALESALVLAFWLAVAVVSSNLAFERALRSLTTGRGRA